MHQEQQEGPPRRRRQGPGLAAGGVASALRAAADAAVRSTAATPPLPQQKSVGGNGSPVGAANGKVLPPKKHDLISFSPETDYGGIASNYEPLDTEDAILMTEDDCSSQAGSTGGFRGSVVGLDDFDVADEGSRHAERMFDQLLSGAGGSGSYGAARSEANVPNDPRGDPTDAGFSYGGDCRRVVNANGPQVCVGELLDLDVLAQNGHNSSGDRVVRLHAGGLQQPSDEQMGSAIALSGPVSEADCVASLTRSRHHDRKDVAHYDPMMPNGHRYAYANTGGDMYPPDAYQAAGNGNPMNTSGPSGSIGFSNQRNVILISSNSDYATNDRCSAAVAEPFELAAFDSSLPHQQQGGKSGCSNDPTTLNDMPTFHVEKVQSMQFTCSTTPQTSGNRAAVAASFPAAPSPSCSSRHVTYDYHPGEEALRDQTLSSQHGQYLSEMGDVDLYYFNDKPQYEGGHEFASSANGQSSAYSDWKTHGRPSGYLGAQSSRIHPDTESPGWNDMDQNHAVEWCPSDILRAGRRSLPSDNLLKDQGSNTSKSGSKLARRAAAASNNRAQAMAVPPINNQPSFSQQQNAIVQFQSPAPCLSNVQAASTCSMPPSPAVPVLDKQRPALSGRTAIPKSRFLHMNPGLSAAGSHNSSTPLAHQSNYQQNMQQRQRHGRRSYEPPPRRQFLTNPPQGEPRNSSDFAHLSVASPADGRTVVLSSPVADSQMDCSSGSTSFASPLQYHEGDVDVTAPSRSQPDPGRTVLLDDDDGHLTRSNNRHCNSTPSPHNHHRANFAAASPGSNDVMSPPFAGVPQQNMRVPRPLPQKPSAGRPHPPPPPPLSQESQEFHQKEPTSSSDSLLAEQQQAAIPKGPIGRGRPPSKRNQQRSGGGAGAGSGRLQDAHFMMSVPQPADRSTTGRAGIGRGAGNRNASGDHVMPEAPGPGRSPGWRENARVVVKSVDKSPLKTDTDAGRGDWLADESLGNSAAGPSKLKTVRHGHLDMFQAMAKPQSFNLPVDFKHGGSRRNPDPSMDENMRASDPSDDSFDDTEARDSYDRWVKPQHSGKKFVDTHCHLDFLFNKLKKSGMEWADFKRYNQSSFPATFEACIADFCEPHSYTRPVPNGGRLFWERMLDHREVYGAFGVHPHFSESYSEDVHEKLMDRLFHPKVVAIGEMGLDYGPKNSTDPEVQKHAFRRQLQMGKEVGKPIVIHCRDTGGGQRASDDCLDILKEQLGSGGFKIHRHCFTGDVREMNLWRHEWPNMYFGLTPLVLDDLTRLRRVIEDMPLNRLVFETDAPYFLPRPGKSHVFGRQRFSHPGFAISVADEVARVKDLPMSEVMEGKSHVFGRQRFSHPGFAISVADEVARVKDLPMSEVMEGKSHVFGRQRFSHPGFAISVADEVARVKDLPMSEVMDVGKSHVFGRQRFSHPGFAISVADEVARVKDLPMSEVMEGKSHVFGRQRFSHPGFAISVADEVARVKDLPMSEVMEVVRENTRTLYGI